MTSSWDLARTLLAFPEQPEVLTADGDKIIGAEVSTYGAYDATDKPCIILEAEE